MKMNIEDERDFWYKYRQRFRERMHPLVKLLCLGKIIESSNNC